MISNIQEYHHKEEVPIIMWWVHKYKIKGCSLHTKCFTEGSIFRAHSIARSHLSSRCNTATRCMHQTIFM